jgi:hypothetical protein
MANVKVAKEVIQRAPCIMIRQAHTDVTTNAVLGEFLCRGGKILLLLSCVMLLPCKGETMNENQKYCSKADKLINEFEKNNDPELLNEADESLENVLIMEEKNPDIRKELRMSSLGLWVRLVGILDRLIDPAFNPDDVPSRLVSPPEDSDGTTCKPGCPPEKIKDPGLRATYIKAIADNKEKTRKYVLQVDLRRLEEQITPHAIEYIRKFITSTPADKSALRQFADKYVHMAARKESLLKLLDADTGGADKNSAPK